MTPFRANRFTIIALVVFFVFLIGYAYFEARNVIRGPVIAVDATEVTVNEPLVLIRGVASNITELRMNGRVIPTTENGAFEEAHLLAPGYNKVTLFAKDKIGRSTTKVIEVVYVPKQATSTGATSSKNI